VARKAKRKTLPKNFEELLKAGDLDALRSVFEICDVNARGGNGKKTALAFAGCPDELTRWLVANGADLGATDTWGATPLHSQSGNWRGRIGVLLELGADVEAGAGNAGTPLHSAARSKRAATAQELLAHGARVDAVDREGRTPLEVALASCSNADLDRMPALVEALLAAGAKRTPEMKELVERIGKTFEFHREGFAPDGLAAADAGLAFLYETFQVPPVPRRRVHDETASITIQATVWQDQHRELWELLVPSKGAAKTVQGEVIRVTGRLANEWEGNGGTNWDQDYSQMATTLPSYLARGTPLKPAELAECQSITRDLRKSGGAGTARLAELAVAWVLSNPKPMALEKPSYRR
jgi:hypothetical protein